MTCQIHPTYIKVIQDSLGSWIERCEFQESRTNASGLVVSGVWISDSIVIGVSDYLS